MLKFHFTFSPAALNEHTALDLDLKALAGLGGLNLPASINSLAEVGSHADLAFSASATLSVDMGIDLSTPTSPRPFLYGDTSLVVDTLANASNINFQAALGGVLGLFIDHGKVYLGAVGADGTKPKPAEFKLAFQNSSQRYYLDAPSSFAFTPTLKGQLTVDLPVDFPTPGTSLDPNQPDLTVSIGDLQAGLSGTPGSIVIAAPEVSGAKLSDDLPSLGQGLSALLDGLQQVVANTAFAKSLPIIGNQLADNVHFFSDLANDPMSQLNSLLEQASQLGAAAIQADLFEVLGPSGANVLGDLNGDGKITQSDVAVVGSDTSHVEFHIKLAQTAPLTTGLNFDAGLPSLGLSFGLGGQAQLAASYAMNLDFGVDTTGGFYVVPAAGGNDLNLTASATIPNFSADGTLGPLQIYATDGTPNPAGGMQTTGLGADFAVSLDTTDPAGTRLYLANVGSLLSNVDVTLTGDAGIHLKLELGTFNGAGPSVSGDLNFDWPFVKADTKDSTATFGDTPSLAIDNVTVYVGSFIYNLVGPLFNEVQQVLAPVEPLLNLLTEDLPVLSSLGIDVNLLDLARAFGYGKAADFIQTAADVVDVIHAIANVTSTAGYNLGDYQISSAAFNPRTTTSLDSVDPSKSADGTFTSSGQSEPADLSNLTSDSKDASHQPILQFPFIENPASLVGLFFGQNPDLVTFNMPALDLGFNWGVDVPIIPPLLDATFAAGFKVHMQFGFGFDTAGFFSGNVLDGFYIDDRQPQVSFTGSLTAGAAVAPSS